MGKIYNKLNQKEARENERDVSTSHFPSLLICCGTESSFGVTDEDITKIDPSSDEITGEAKDTYSDTLMDTPTVKDEMGMKYSLKFVGSGTLMEFKVGDMVKVSIGNRHIASNGIFALERTVVQNGEFKVTIPVYLALSPGFLPHYKL